MMFVTAAVLDTFREFLEKPPSQSKFFSIVASMRYAEKHFVRDVF